jgi:hypothetical protein
MYTLTFGKYKGSTIESVFESDESYVRWLAANSYNKQARAAAQAVIAQSACKSADAEQQLTDSLRAICRAKKRPSLSAYKYVDFEVRNGYAEIQMCTHNLHTQHGFTEDLFDANWDIVEIKTSHEDLEEYDEEEEEQQRPRRRQVLNIAADAKIWYPIHANRLLASEPMTLVEAVDALESHLLKSK